jgi:hypothetical protein
MPLLGNAAIAMWWTVANEHLDEFHEWHSKEHLPERLAINGFNRGSRWQQEDTGKFFVIYELETYETLVSDAYRTRLNNPTSWSTKMMPLHRDMVRSQCKVVASHGQGVAPFLTTLRISPGQHRQQELTDYLDEALKTLPQQPGIIGAHFLRTETPNTPATTEQKIRGSDRAADWIILISGHNLPQLTKVTSDRLSSDVLGSHGAVSVVYDAPFRMVHVLVAQDI